MELLNVVLNVFHYVTFAHDASSLQRYILHKRSQPVVKCSDLLFRAFDLLLVLFDGFLCRGQELFGLSLVGFDHFFIFDHLVFQVLDLVAIVSDQNSDVLHVR